MKKLFAALLCLIMVALVTASCGTAKPSAVKITTASDLAGKKIGVQDGTTGADYVKNNYKTATVKAYATPALAVQDLKLGRIDAVVLDKMPALALAKVDPTKIKVLDNDLTTEHYAIAVRKGDSALLSKINATIERMKTDGTYDKYTKDYITGAAIKSDLPALTGTGDPLKVGLNATFPPYEYKDDSNKIDGFDVALASEIANDAKMKLAIQDMDFSGLIAALNAKKIDCIISGMTDTPEREKNVDFSESYYDAAQVIIVRQ